MDKYEYKVRSEEIKRLIGENDYIQAAEIADTIDWRRVKSVMMLCMVSDLYKINRRYDDAKNMLLLAYERRPGGRTICYSLCELCIKTEDFLQAVNYYKEFVQAAPKDPGRYVLQYKIYEAQEVSLEERIGVLEELKKRDYREKWAYELAYLYHRVGLGTRCVEECDELILWFGSGKYVIKAMELKMLHQPLTPAQQDAYDHRFDEQEQTQELVSQDQEYGGEPEYAQGDIYGQEYAGYENEDYIHSSIEEGEQFPSAEGEAYVQTGYWDTGEIQAGQEEMPEQDEISDEEEELDIQVKTMDVGQFNTINLQEELAAGLQEVLGAAEDGESEAVNVPEERRASDFSGQEDSEETFPYSAGEEAEEDVEVFFGETGELKNVSDEVLPDTALSVDGKGADSGIADAAGTDLGDEDVSEADRKAADPSGQNFAADDLYRQDTEKADARKPIAEKADVRQTDPDTDSNRKITDAAADRTGELVLKEMREESDRAEKETASVLQSSDIQPSDIQPSDRRSPDVQPPKELAGVLSQETDGQLRLVVPESAAIEKQITGQMKIEDILSEWERMKKESQEKCREEVRRRVLEQTGPMFTEFEAAVRDGLLEQLDTDKDAEPAGEFHEEGAGEDGYLTAEGGEIDEEDFGEDEYLTAEGGEIDEEDFVENGYLTAEGGEIDEEGFVENGYLTAEDGEIDEEGTVEDGYLTAEGGEIDEEGSLEDEYLTAEDGEIDEEGSLEDEYLTAEDGEIHEEGTAEDEYLAAEDGEANGEAGYLEPDLEAPYEEEDTDEYLTAGEEIGGETEEDVNEDDLTAELKGACAEDWDESEEDDFDGADAEADETAAEEALEQEGTGEADSDIPEGWKESEAQTEADGQAEPKGETGAEQQTKPEEQTESEGQTKPEENSEGRSRKSRKALRAERAAAKKEKAEKQSIERGDEEDRETEEQEEENLQAERPPVERDRAKVRALTREEKELYAPFIQSRRSREQLVKAIDNISMAAYTGNIVVTGEEGMDTMTLVQNMIREVQLTDSNFSGKVAKISGKGLNDRDVKKTLEEMNGGALIIYGASGMNKDTARSLYRSLQQERLGIIVALEDTKKGIQKLFKESSELTGAFTARMDMEALSNDTLVMFGRRYAREMEYSIDDLGILALHTRIEELQTIDHVVTVVDVKKIVDDAIRHAGRKTLGHFFDILFAKRYDDEDMIILTEKDFVA